MKNKTPSEVVEIIDSNPVAKSRLTKRLKANAKQALRELACRHGVLHCDCNGTCSGGCRSRKGAVLTCPSQ